MDNHPMHKNKVYLAGVLICSLSLLSSACKLDTSKSQEMSIPDASPEVSEEVTDYMPLCSDQYVLPAAQRANWQEINDEAIKATFSIPPSWTYEKSDRFGSYGYDGYRIASYDLGNEADSQRGSINLEPGEVVLSLAIRGNDKRSDETMLDYMKRDMWPLTPPSDAGEYVIGRRTLAYNRNQEGTVYLFGRGANVYRFWAYGSAVYDQKEAYSTSLVQNWKENMSEICSVLESVELHEADPIPFAEGAKSDTPPGAGAWPSE